MRLPHPGTYPSFGLSLGFVIAVGLLAVFMVLLLPQPLGLRLRMVGANPMAARRFGVKVAAVAGGALVISGALAGLAGSVMLTGRGVPDPGAASPTHSAMTACWPPSSAGTGPAGCCRWRSCSA